MHSPTQPAKAPQSDIISLILLLLFSKTKHTHNIKLATKYVSVKCLCCV